MIAGATSFEAPRNSATKGGSTSPEVHDVGDLIVASTGERYSSFAKGRLLTAAPPDTEIIPAAELLQPGRFSALLARGSARFPPGTDQRALASYWSLFYVSTAVIGSALSWLTIRRVLPFNIGRIGIIIDPQSTAARGFLLPDLGTVDENGDADIFAAMRPIIRGHLDPLIEALARESGLSRKVFWTNTAAYLAWVIDEVGRHSGEHLRTEGERLLHVSHWPDGWSNPMHRAIRYQSDEHGAVVGHRRVCCLRYAVPGVGGCGATCPVPEGRLNGRA